MRPGQPVKSRRGDNQEHQKGAHQYIPVIHPEDFKEHPVSRGNQKGEEYDDAGKAKRAMNKSHDDF